MMIEEMLNNEVFDEAIELDEEALEDVTGGTTIKIKEDIMVHAHAHIPILFRVEEVSMRYADTKNRVLIFFQESVRKGIPDIYSKRKK